MEVKREKAFAFHLKGTVQCRDPDREVRCRGGGGGGGGEQSSRPLEKEGAWSPKSFFRSLGPQYDLKIRGVGGGGGGPPAPRMDPPPQWRLIRDL